MRTGCDGDDYKKIKMALIKATKGAKRAVFSELAWASGQPQRYGWHSEEDEPKKKLPAEILEFATIRKKINELTVPTVEEVEVKKTPEVKPKVKSKVKPKAEKKPAPKKKETKA